MLKIFMKKRRKSGFNVKTRQDGNIGGFSDSSGKTSLKINLSGEGVYLDDILEEVTTFHKTTLPRDDVAGGDVGEEVINDTPDDLHVTVFKAKRSCVFNFKGTLIISFRYESNHDVTGRQR
jgi:hypothetical protein